LGYLDGNDLWTYSGRHIGKLRGIEVYGPDGGYLGELVNGDRLITNVGKRDRHSMAFSPRGRRRSFACNAHYEGEEPAPGYADFSYHDLG
jgi:hypothetical protein